MARPLKMMPLKKPKVYSLTEDVAQAIKKTADDAGVSQSLLVQKILESFLKLDNKQIDLFGGDMMIKGQ